MRPNIYTENSNGIGEPIVHFSSRRRHFERAKKTLIKREEKSRKVASMPPQLTVVRT